MARSKKARVPAYRRQGIFDFLALPPELRSIVYTYALFVLGSVKIRWMDRKRDRIYSLNRPLAVGLAYTCRKILHEARMVLFSNNWSFSASSTVPRFVTNIPAAAKYVQRVTCDFEKIFQRWERPQLLLALMQLPSLRIIAMTGWWSELNVTDLSNSIFRLISHVDMVVRALKAVKDIRSIEELLNKITFSKPILYGPGSRVRRVATLKQCSWLNDKFKQILAATVKDEVELTPWHCTTAGESDDRRAELCDLVRDMCLTCYRSRHAHTSLTSLSTKTGR